MVCSTIRTSCSRSICRPGAAIRLQLTELKAYPDLKAIEAWARPYYPRVADFAKSVDESRFAQPVDFPWSAMIVEKFGKALPATLGESVFHRSMTHTAYRPQVPRSRSPATRVGRSAATPTARSTFWYYCGCGPAQARLRRIGDAWRAAAFADRLDVPLSVAIASLSASCVRACAAILMNSLRRISRRRINGKEVRCSVITFD